MPFFLALTVVTAPETNSSCVLAISELSHVARQASAGRRCDD
jgi:hypothetical protein